MSTPEQPTSVSAETTDQVANSTETQMSFHLGAAVLSFVLPEVGQLTQSRGGAFFGHLLLYVLAAICPYGVLCLFWASLPPYMSESITPVFLLLPLPFLMILFSSLDAACWKHGKPSRMYRPIRILGNVIVCVFVGLMLIMPMISAAREAARRMQCSGNLKQLALAVHYYHDVYKVYPPAYTVDESGKSLHSWRVLLLPYMDYKELYDEIRLDEPWDSEYNRQFHSRVPNVFRCPSAKGDWVSWCLEDRYPNMERGNFNCNYSVIVGEQTIFPGSRSTKYSEVTDGTSNTLLIVERLVPICWMDPMHEITFDDASCGVNASVYGIGSAHVGGCNVALADGSTNYTSETMQPELLKTFLTRAGNETVTCF